MASPKNWLHMNVNVIVMDDCEKLMCECVRILRTIRS